MEPLTFPDLAPADRDLTAEEHAWLGALARDTDPTQFTVNLGPSAAADDAGPVVACDQYGTWRAGRYIGELYRDGRVIEIRPRLGIETIAHWAGAALNVRITPRSGEHTGSQMLIAELLAAAWRSAIVDASRHGPPGIRVPRTHTAEVAKGRIDVAGTLKLRAAGRPQIASVSRPKNLDNPITRTIVAADRVLDRRLHRPGWRGERVEEVMPRLRATVGARPTLPTHRELASVRYTPITLPYRRAAELSHQIARHRGLQSCATGDRADGLLIDVAELWELFLVHCARRAFGAANVTHGTALTDGGALLRSQQDPSRTLGRLYPDIIIGPVENPVAIIDAKYKPLADPRGVDREDLYQLNAYLAAHVQGPHPLGALAYVQFPDQARIAYAETRGPWRTSVGHNVSFARMPTTESECVDAFHELVNL
ncbi:5-methylcytosine restriction system specificity protein McrC [Tsukamurella pseudospumae]|uniref:Restriction endonuclease n=1 Tax=Tsukamurella pseudospumae TaxID=239498 RepID=A0A138ADY1_9ACTN|nr:hypothetical protein [Tsukamurella pseudospumae]KXP08708.1 hypothetical protein AXK60_08520 [Tsukamurella pseudospumae]